MFKVYILTEKQLEDNGYPFIYKKSDSLDLMAYLPKPISQQASIQNKYSIHKHMITTAKYNSSSEIKLCKRCTKTFTINKKFEYKAKDDCVHHWGKLRKVRGRLSFNSEILRVFKAVRIHFQYFLTKFFSRFLTNLKICQFFN